ncbi:MAG: triple tyrosine motif-containing protein [Bryobacteraceae bacterium]
MTTSRGVLRFDGVRFESVAEATFGAVDPNEIDSAFHPAGGGLWLTTMSAGLLFWKDGRLTAFPDRRCTPTRKMGRLVEDRDGSLWVEGAAGLFHLRGSVCEQVGAQQGYPGGFAAGLLMDRAGTLWVKTRSGPLLFLRRGAAKFEVSPYGNGPSTSYAFLHEGPDGAVWMSDDQGLRRVEGGTAAPAAKAPGKKPPFGDFAFGPDGSLWAVTTNGIERFVDVEGWTAAGEIFTPEQGLSSDAIWKVLIDREGSVWVATNSGIDRLRRNLFSTQALPRTEEREFAIAPGDGGSIWTGNSSLPLTHIGADGAAKGFPATGETIAIRRDHSGGIWSAGAGDFYLWRSSASGFTPVHYPEEKLDAVVSVATDRHGDPWITTRSGRVYHFADGTWSNQTKAIGKKAGVIGAMADDEAGNVWFAFSDRVVEWDGAAYHTAVRKERGVSETTMSVRGDHVWLAGPGGVQLGVQLFGGGSFSTMRWQNAELPGRVSGVVETRDGDLWTNGFSGVAHVPAAELKKWLRDRTVAVSAEHFDESDGLPGLSGEKLPEPSVVEGSDGRLWFATTRGIAFVDPKALDANRNRLPPPVAVPAVTANGKRYEGANGLILPPRTENLEIDYAALSMAMPERVPFRYKLEGVDKDWQDAATRRQACYTRLGPGRYRFRVMACNNDGLWSKEGAALGFTIAPAWFQTAWFRLLAVACGLAAVLLLHWVRVRLISTRINARFAERLADRNLVAQELHDTLLQGFLSASMQVHIARDRLPDDSPVKPMLSRSLELMAQVIEEGRNALRGIRSSSMVSPNLEEAFAQMRQEFREPHEFHLFVEGQKKALDPFLRDEIYRIGREGLTNAFRHAQATRVEIELQYGSRDFRLLVRDDGRGIDERKLKSRNGQGGFCRMHEQATRIGGRLQVFSAPSGGTEVELLVPGGIAYEGPPHPAPALE